MHNKSMFQGYKTLQDKTLLFSLWNTVTIKNGCHYGKHIDRNFLTPVSTSENWLKDKMKY